MYKKILVPIDLSHMELGKEMIELARKYGDKGADITLLHVIEDIPAYISAYIPNDVIHKPAEVAHAALQELTRETGLQGEVRVASGSPAGTILRLAEEMKADLIIIASHQPGLQDYLLGSTAGRVVRHAHCSVLVRR